MKKVTTSGRSNRNDVTITPTGFTLTGALRKRVLAVAAATGQDPVKFVMGAIEARAQADIKGAVARLDALITKLERK